MNLKALLLLAVAAFRGLGAFMVHENIVAAKNSRVNPSEDAARGHHPRKKKASRAQALGRKHPPKARRKELHNPYEWTDMEDEELPTNDTVHKEARTAQKKTKRKWAKWNEPDEASTPQPEPPKKGVNHLKPDQASTMQPEPNETSVNHFTSGETQNETKERGVNYNATHGFDQANTTQKEVQEDGVTYETDQANTTQNDVSDEGAKYVESDGANTTQKDVSDDGVKHEVVTDVESDGQPAFNITPKELKTEEDKPDATGAVGRQTENGQPSNCQCEWAETPGNCKQKQDDGSHCFSVCCKHGRVFHRKPQNAAVQDQPENKVVDSKNIASREQQESKKMVAREQRIVENAVQSAAMSAATAKTAAETAARLASHAEATIKRALEIAAKRTKKGRVDTIAVNMASAAAAESAVANEAQVAVKAAMAAHKEAQKAIQIAENGIGNTTMNDESLVN